jgi:voltage-gated potassium channel
MSLKIIYSISIIVFLLATGTIYFHNKEQWSYVDSFYFSTMTLTTIGFGDLVPTTKETKIFTSFYAMLGIGTMLYFLGHTIGGYLFSKEKLFDKLVNRISRTKKTKEKEKEAKKLVKKIIKK